MTAASASSRPARTRWWRIAQRPRAADRLVCRRDGRRARRLCGGRLRLRQPQRLRDARSSSSAIDFTWVYASLYQDDFGMYMLNEPERSIRTSRCRGSRCGAAIGHASSIETPRRRARPVPESRSVVGEGIVTLKRAMASGCASSPQRGDAARAHSPTSRVVIQVGRSEALDGRADARPGADPRARPSDCGGGCRALAATRWRAARWRQSSA